MDLTVAERLMLLAILPKEGDYTTLRIVRKLREDLSFSEAEHDELGITVRDGLVRWTALASGHRKAIDIGKKAGEVIGAALVDLDERKKLTLDHIHLYEAFVPQVELEEESGPERKEALEEELMA